MKPIKLIMYGFMTYKEKTEIDFTKLYQSRIFVISGDTGSGKTSIFDAISFALFGEISRKDVEQINLRSDFLGEDDPPTYVDFSFELDGKNYQILRKPTQFAKKKIKAGVKINHEVEFYEIKNNQKQLLSDKVNETLLLVKQILGLDQSQLKKVMLLAQGEFQDFLISDSATKRSLLSDIFQTGKYGLITEIMKEKSKSYTAQLDLIDSRLVEEIQKNQDLSNSIDQSLILKHDFTKIEDEIENVIKIKENQISEIEKENKEKNIKKDDFIDQMSKARILNENISTYNNLKIKKENLSENIHYYKEHRKILDQAKKAISIKAYHENILDIELSIKNIESLINKKEEEKLKTTKVFSKLKKELVFTKVLEKEIDQLKIYLNELYDKKNSYKKFIDIKSMYENGKKEKEILEKIDEKLNNLKTKYTQTSEKLIENTNQLIELNNKNSKLLLEKSSIDKNIDLNNEEYLKYEKNKKIEEKILSIKNQIVKIKIDITQTEQLLEKARINKENIQKDKYIKILNQTGICPICGSIHEEKFKEEEIKDYDLDSINERYQKLINDKLMGEMEISFNKNSLLENVRKIEDITEDKNLLTKKTDIIKNSIEENKKNLDDLNFIIEKLNRTKEIISSQKDDIENKRSKLIHRLSSFEDIERTYLSMKDDLKDLSFNILNQNIENNLKDLKEKQELNERIRTEFSLIDKKLAEINSSLKTNKETLKNYKNNLEINNEKFISELKKYFNDKKEFLESVENYNSLITKEDEIENFFDQFKTVSIKLDSLKEYEGKNLIDIKIFENDIRILNEKINELSENLTKLKVENSNLREIREKIIKIKIDYNKKISDGQILSKLSKIASGNKGAVKSREKLDFETFVLIYYFEKILSYSNKRLYKMSNGQYRMIRKKSGGDLRSRQGLDIEIIDSNTGKIRPASTLSGGETFLASLSLALGLSDEIAAENGGIKIDTLFIDEGFGSLSQNYLENAISTIEKISYENKFIGLISHVKELKDSIDAKILVKYDKSKGSEVKLIV